MTNSNPAPQVPVSAPINRGADGLGIDETHRAIAQFGETTSLRAARFMIAGRRIGTTNRWLLAIAVGLGSITSITAVTSAVPRPLVAAMSGLSAVIVAVAAKLGSNERASKFIATAYSFQSLERRADMLVLRLPRLDVETAEDELQGLHDTEAELLRKLGDLVVPTWAMKRAALLPAIDPDGSSRAVAAGCSPG